MRNILIASTALVAVAGVSAASAEVAVSLDSSFKYESYDDGSADNGTSYSFGNVVGFSVSRALDNGLTITAFQEIEDGAMGDRGASISGDFGKINLGPNGTGIPGDYDVEVTPNYGDGNIGVTADPAGAEAVSGGDISYNLPSINGFSVGFGYKDAGASGAAKDTVAYGVSYKMALDLGSVEIGTSRSTVDAGATNTSMGITVSSGDFTVVAVQNSTDNASGADYKGTGLGLTYAMNDALTLSAALANNSNDGGSAYKSSINSYGAEYTITDGLAASLTYNSASEGSSSGSGTVLELSFSF